MHGKIFYFNFYTLYIYMELYIASVNTIQYNEILEKKRNYTRKIGRIFMLSKARLDFFFGKK